jgi:lysyl-tRNA synthetase, class I
MWLDKVVNKLEGPQIINDSKTPSGRVHVGSLRGVLIHDAVLRELRERDMPAKFIYGIDDYDPMDGLPADAPADIFQYMGMPLCNIPAPAGSSATDMANHYIQEFLDIFRELNVEAEVYRMRDVYRSGKFNESIDIILKNAHVVREIYEKVSGSVRPDNWHPFQVICEKCGKIGTTVVSAYDGKEVTYHCQPDLVKWAEGCDFRGKVSPFDGKGKLPWKLEWAAKWHTLGITIEGAGKDHCTKGGSRDIAVAVLRQIFHERPPKNIPYEFFLVSGAKMSSSKGVGSTARDMADFLPPEILRFLMVGPVPTKAVNFNTSLQYIVKLFNDYDRHLEQGNSDDAVETSKRLLVFSKCSPTSDSYQPANFQLITTLTQLPHVDLQKEVEKRSSSLLSDSDIMHMEQRIVASRYWLEKFATAEDTFTVQDTLPAAAQDLTVSQWEFLHLFSAALQNAEDSDDAIQSLVFEVARHTPISQPDAFNAIYMTILGKARGPKAGSLISFLDRDFVVKRCREISFGRDEFLSESVITQESFFTWLEGKLDSIESAKISYELNIVRPENFTSPEASFQAGKGIINCSVINKGKEFLFLVLSSTFSGLSVDQTKEASNLLASSEGLINKVRSLKIETSVVDEVQILIETNDEQIALYKE